jgi:hypothetical protein
MRITIPKLSLVALIGPIDSGKSTFARKHFKPTEVFWRTTAAGSCRMMRIAWRLRRFLPRMTLARSCRSVGDRPHAMDAVKGFRE